MQAPMKQLVCVKWGSAYGPEYVNRLYGMVSRHLTPPFRLVCLTDDRNRIRAEVECFDLPELGVPHPQRTVGKWRKQVLWGATVPGLRTGEPALFIDLDSVIVGSLDDYFGIGQPGDVYVARNWARPLEKLGQTSVFRFPVGGNAHLLADFRADPQGIADKYQFEQHYVTFAVTGGVKFWPEAWTRHFRLHCMPPFPLCYFMTARLPQGARIVTFPGGPNGSMQSGCATCAATCCRCRGSRRPGGSERRPVKIVHLLFTHSFAGTERHAIELANAQAQTHEVTMLLHRRAAQPRDTALAHRLDPRDRAVATGRGTGGAARQHDADRQLDRPLRTRGRRACAAAPRVGHRRR